MTNSEMVERVARAICTASGVDPDIVHTDKFGEKLVCWIHFEPQARAAIEAMREPTRVMVYAGDLEGGGHYSFAKLVFQAMIDAALQQSATNQGEK